MKQLYTLLLLALALCLTPELQAQQAEKSKDDTKVIIVKRTVDKDGEVIVEKIVTSESDLHEVEDVEIEMDVVVEGEGNEVHVVKIHDADHKVFFSHDENELHENHVEVKVEQGEHGKTIWISSNGEQEVIELHGEAQMTEKQKAELKEKGIHLFAPSGAMEDGSEGNIFIIEHDEDDSDQGDYGFGNKIHEMTTRFARMDFDKAFHTRARGTKQHSNCVALGVFVHSQHGGALVSGVIEGSGAKEAGLQSGDVIVKINDHEVSSVKSLHVALGNYEPGEMVKVTFKRDEDFGYVQSELRAWGDLPDYKDSWRANVKCGDENYQQEYDFLASPEVTKKIIIIKKDAETPEVEEEIALPQESTAFDYNLELENFTVFPNPSDGIFRVQFEASPKPLTLSVFDGSGREIYRDNMSDFNGFYNKEIDLTDAPRGTMFVTIVQDGKRYADMVILQ